MSTTTDSDLDLDDRTKALVDSLIASTLEYFTNESSATEWDPALGPSQIGCSYHDYEDPLSSYERQLLEDPSAGEGGESWGMPEDGTADAAKVAHSSDVPWDADAETSEAFKQDQIMMAQHGQVMEERALNGLRIPSPPPRPGDGRIAVIANSLRMARPGTRLPVLFPASAVSYSPPSQFAESHGRRKRHQCYQSEDVGQSSPNPWQGPTSTLNSESASHARRHERNANHWNRRERSLEDQLDGYRENGALNSHPSQFHSDLFPTTPPILPESDQGNLAEPQEADDGLQPHSPTTPPTRHRVRFSNTVLTEDDDPPSNDSDTSTPRPTKNKGKGKERAASPSPSPKAGYPSSSLATTPSMFDADAVYDTKTGEYVVYIPWSYRDLEQDRINDSRVTEIILGETEGDECEIRVLYGVVGSGDFAEEGRKMGGGSRSGGIHDDDDDYDYEDDEVPDLYLRGGIARNERLVLRGF